LLSEGEFLAASRSEVALWAPPAVVYAASGTRRSAALAGLSPSSDEYAHWSWARMIEACGLLFDHGVQHIFTVLATPGQFAEVGQYRQRLLDWIAWGVESGEALAEYARLGWRVRLLCGEEVPELAAVRLRLEAQRSVGFQKTLWFLVVENADAPWSWILEAVKRSGANSRREAIRALYGEDLPLITLYVSFGKPILAPELLPPLLAGTVQCYWTQRPGYSLTEEELRLILYDFAFLRPTWQSDKCARSEEALEYRASWERGPLLGLGTRLGPFWYPREQAADSATQ